MDTVAIDIDSTLADIVRPWLLLAEKKYGVKAFKENMVQYDFWNLLNISKKESYEMFEELWSRPEMVMMEDRDIPSIMDNIGSTFNIRILTATLGKDADVKRWLRMNKIRFHEFVHVEHSNIKHMLEGVAVYVDDAPKVVKEIANAGKRAIMLRQPWNADFDAKQYSGRITIAENWRQIEGILVNKEYL